MKTRRLVILACLLCLAGAWFFRQQSANTRIKPSAPAQAAAPAASPATTASNPLATASTNDAASAKTNEFAYRLSNTTKSLDQLVNDRHAILLENALIDSSRPLNLSIPKNLLSQGDPGAYIIQARGPIDNAFRATLAQAGAEIVSYIPNNAYLVRAPAGVANGLSGNPLTQSVTPYEPYYKISSSMPVTAGQRTLSSVPMGTNRAAGPSLLELAVKQLPLPAGTCLTLGLFNNSAAATEAQIEKLGGLIVGRDRSPFGPVLRVQPPKDWVALAALPGVQIVEPLRQRMHANDLSRMKVGVATNTVVASNYMNLSGLNVLVQVNDTGIDATHPDFKTGNGLPVRVFGSPTTDTDGHGTHVAGIIAGNGFESTTVTNAQGSILTNIVSGVHSGSPGQFRGMAPLAKLLSMDWLDSDQELEEAAAQANALISNNSWNYGGDTAYDLAAASYDAAVRDALPGVTGSQPVLFVFSAGNDGSGGDDGTGGNSDSILSPATAKNVITVGALEQLRSITNSVTNYYGNPNPQAVWKTKTDSSSQIAGYSSRGNVGIGMEGTFGRFKPDVVAPGSFVISTRSEQWNQYAYYDPTNTSFNEINNEFLYTNAVNYYQISIPGNAVALEIQIITNSLSPFPFPTNLSVFVSLNNFPNPSVPGTYDFVTASNGVSIPPNSGGGISGIQSVQNVDLEYAVWNTNNFSVYYDINVFVMTTNPVGNYFQVLSNLNNSIGTSPYYYRYESGTSMSAADVSGVLALMQDYFINHTAQTNPSPALLKALLINGARATGSNPFAVTNAINLQGWGLVNLTNALPFGITNKSSAACASFYIDQSPTNALATGDSHTYAFSIASTNIAALVQPLRVTLAWTDPPGDPAAAIKLVNNLDLVVSNTATHAVYFGNNFASSGNPPFSQPSNSNSVPDSINNVENVFLAPLLGTNYVITVVGRSVNVNAVTAHTNGVVQDYVLVISSANGQVTNAVTMTGESVFSIPSTSAQQITYVTSTNAPLLNQFVGASSPLLGTNQIQLMNNGTEINNIQLDPTNLPLVTNLLTLGVTNQWHFFVVTNPVGGNADVTNAAFITFIPNNLSVSRMGVFAGNVTNATRPEADIDLYVSANPNLMLLYPNVISNADKSLGRGGIEFVAYSNSAPGKVYYVGVYSEDQEASEFGFIPIFTDVPFSQINPNGSQTVNGLVLPVNIPDKSGEVNGIGYAFALALNPMEIKRVVVTDTFLHQNFGDLIGALTHGGENGLSQAAILNNHDPLGNLSVPYATVYDDSGFGDQTSSQISQISDGPGSLNNFIGQQADGPWLLTEADEAVSAVGSVTGFSLLIEPHQDLTKVINATLGPLGWFYDFIDVPSGVTGMTISATNTTQPASQVGLEGLFVRYGVIPTLTNFDSMTLVTNNSVVGLFGSISNGLPLPPGRYWIGLYNYSILTQSNYLIVKLTQGTVPGESIFTSAGQVPILDDAVTTNSIEVPANQTISSMEVGLRVDHPRVSDLVFHLISPDGTRVLLVENRGGTTTNGMGATTTITNIVPVTSSGGAAASTAVINVATDSGTVMISYNFYTIPDRMVVEDQTGIPIFDSGVISGSGVFNVAYTNSSSLTIVMNPGGGSGGEGDYWDYTVNALQGKQSYLVLTEDTNRTTTPIKFAPPPFVPFVPAMATNPPAWHGSFEGAVGGGNLTGIIDGGWLVVSGNVDLNTTGTFGYEGPADEGTNYIDLDGNTPGTISTNIATVAGQSYTLSFAYARNPGSIGVTVPQASVLINGLVMTNVVADYTNSWPALGWKTMSFTFTAPANTTTIIFQSTDSPGNVSGVLLDCIDLTSSDLNDGFENTYAGDYAAGTNPGFGGWAVTTNQVTVISNSTLAYSGTNLLALADGTISRVLPTIPGTTYTLSYAYRGPGAVALWRGESNTLDSINGNNPTAVSNITYTAGEVGLAFQYNGSNSLITVPPSASLAVSNLTIDAWVYPTDDSTPYPVVEYGGAGQYSSIALWINTTGGGGTTAGGIQAYVRTENMAAFLQVLDYNPDVIVNQWNHLAFTVNAATLTGTLYCNGVQVDSEVTVPDGSPVTPVDFGSAPVNIGYRDVNSSDIIAGSMFLGDLDEVSIYNRDLSASEILAIYNQGTNHLTKFATNAPFVAQGLAEAQLTLNGTPQPIFFGNNTNWQTATISFTATSNNTPLQIAGLEPGMLLDNFVMTTIPTNSYDLYYLPEQSLDLLTGKNALGLWQLEIQDDRAGAMVPTPSLVSWQLRFNFPYSPPTIPTLTPGQVIIGTVPPGGIAYYEVIVPTNADISTNILLNTTGTLNLLFGLNTPPIGILPPDYLLFTSPSTVSNSTTLTTASVPNFAAGGIYYLGVQNLNPFPVNYGIAVNFHLTAPPLVLPALPELLAITNTLFTVTNAATGGLPPLTNQLFSTVPGAPFPVITNGVITWTPTAATPAPAVYTFTNIANDSSNPTQWATNIFHVLVVLTNGQPAFPGAEGAGGFAIGGRGGDVYHVVNLNDSGPGSLRNGIVSTFGSRTIVFDVSGAINLFSPLQINNPYITIAAQTAPGAGITIQGLTTSAESIHGAVEHAHDEVLRFLRCRPGDIYAQYVQGDSFQFVGVTNSIADHISASWSLDTVLSTTYSTNITVQWSMIAEPLDHSAYTTNSGAAYQEHGYGSLIRYGSGAVSYLHNLYADSFSDNPRVGDNIRLDFINNVVCNWGEAAGTNQDDAAANPAGYTNYLNYRGNYFIAGSNTTANPGIAFASGVTNVTYTQIYQSTNFIDDNPTNVLNGTNTLWSMFNGLFTQLASATPITNGVFVATNSPAFAYEQVLAFAGATMAAPTAAGGPAAGTSLLRDPVDTNIVTGVRNKSGQIVDFISTNSFTGVYLRTNYGVTWSGYTNAAGFWVAQGFTNFVGVNPWPVLASAPQPLDSDGDGLPDYWEITLKALGTNTMNPAVPNNNHSNPDGYTDLEDYLNWLGAPHALTVSNTAVYVDLYAVVGRTGNLTFGVTNGTNGTVVLTNSIATFTPSNNYFGFASFGFSVTNLATTNRFDVTVSVMVSITNITTTSLPLTNAVPQTNNVVPAGSFAYFLVTVPPNALLATNILISPSAPLNVWFSRAGFPTGTNTGDYILLTNSLGGSSLLGAATNYMPTNIIPGGTYYLGVQNLSGGPVSFGIEVDFYPPPTTPPVPPLSAITITSITYTNNGFLLKWQGPTNYQYQIQWATNLSPLVWSTVLNPVITAVLTATNGHYSWFDNGTLTGGPALLKLYRIIAGVNLGPVNGSGPATNTVLPGTTSQAVVSVPAGAISASNFLISATGPLNVWYNPTNPPTGSTGAGDFELLTNSIGGSFVLTSSSLPPLVPGTNYYLGFQNPGTSNVTFIFDVAFGYLAPSISKITLTTNGLFQLQWTAPTNYQFQVEWTTNLMPPIVWNFIPPSPPYITSTNVTFTFVDTNPAVQMKFYRLIQRYP